MIVGKTPKINTSPINQSVIKYTAELGPVTY